MILLDPLYTPEILTIYRTSGEVVSFTLFVLALVAIINWKLFQGAFFFLFLNICVTALIDGGSLYLVRMGVGNTQWLSHLNIFQEALLLGFFYHQMIQNSVVKKSVLGVIILSCSLLVVNFFWKDGYLEIPTKSGLVEAMFFSVYAIFLHRQSLLDKRIDNVYRYAAFWFNLYVLISFVSNILFYFIFNESILQSNDLSMIFYTIKNGVGLLCFGFWIVGLLSLRKNAIRVA